MQKSYELPVCVSTSSVCVSVSDSDRERFSGEVMGEKAGPVMDSESCDSLSSELSMLWGRAPKEREVS